MLQQNTFARIAILSVILAVGVVTLGAFTRLSDAGLGCPDWPGCYGKIIVPNTAPIINAPDQMPFMPDKAWIEMIHRYFAGSLACIAAFIAVAALRKKIPRTTIPHSLSLSILVVIATQALLGMWTVTFKLLPIVVMAHLLGGMLLSSLLLLNYLYLTQAPTPPSAATSNKPFRYFTIAGIILLTLQILLGGATSANYAALSCPDFPFCTAQHPFPHNFYSAFFTFPHNLDANFLGGHLEYFERATIHMTHRLGAVITAIIVGFTAIYGIKSSSAAIKNVSVLLLLLLILQLGLGMLNILLRLPIVIAVAHNGCALLMLLSLVALCFLSYRKSYA